MKHNSSKAPVNGSVEAHNPTAQKSLDSENWGPEQEDNDPLWNLLGEASDRKPDPFFARNVVRSTRLLENTSNASGAWFSRVTSLFTQRTSRRLALGAAACVCALATYQMWPNTEAPEAKMAAAAPQPSPPVTVTSPAETELSELSELVIAETLEAVAEDPTIFTHDEVVAMIGF